MLIENAAEFRTFSGKFRKFKIARGPEADDEDAFAVWRHHALRVDDFLVNAVAEFLGEGAVDDFERAPWVVPQQVLHVFQHERGRLVMVQDGGDVEEEVALLLVLEAVLAAEAEFLRDARDAEGLAGKSGAENVERRNVGDGHGVNVAMRFLAEVGFVGDLRVLVPIAGENALAARALERDAEPANAAEEIDEGEGRDRINRMNRIGFIL